MDLLSLPCGRHRHGSCAGEFALGVARYRRVHECICTCHLHPSRREAHQALLDLVTTS